MAVLKEAIAKAKEVAANDDATVAEVNEACSALREAMNGLVELADKNKLADEIAKNYNNYKFIKLSNEEAIIVDDMDNYKVIETK